MQTGNTLGAPVSRTARFVLRAAVLLSLLVVLASMGSPAFARAAGEVPPEKRKATLSELVLTIEVVPGGAVAISQRYTFAATRGIEDFETWLPTHERIGPFYRDMELTAARAFGPGGVPIPFRLSESPSGTWLRVIDVAKYFEHGPELLVAWRLGQAFRGTTYDEVFFGNDSFDAAVESIRLEIRWPGSVEDFRSVAPTYIRGAERIPLVQESLEDGHAVFVLERAGLRMPLELDLGGLTLSEEALGSTAGFWSASLVTSNLWLWVPLVFLAVLLLAYSMMSTQGGSMAEGFSPSARLPSGIDPATAATMLHGGVCSRTYASALLWLAHRGKVALEYRPGGSNPLVNMTISKRDDPDMSFRDHERLLWQNVLFQGVDAISLDRLASDLGKGRRRHVLRDNMKSMFPSRLGILPSEVREWWLWPPPVQLAGITLLALGLFLVLSGLGLVMPSFAKTEWLFGWPLMIGAGALFLGRSPWRRGAPDKGDKNLMEFVAFLHQDRRALSDLRGNVQGFSILLPYAVAAGAEHNVFDAYCEGAAKVRLPAWFLVHGSTSEEVHPDVLREYLSDVIEAMIRAL